MFKWPGSDLLRVHGFRFSFTPLAGVLFAFPSRYFFAIGRIPYLALDRGRPGFRRDFSCPAVLRIPLPSAYCFGYGAFTPSGRLSQNRSPTVSAQLSRSCNPGQKAGLGSSGFARRYFRNLMLISVPGVLRWFSSPSFASAPYVFGARMPESLPAGYPIRQPADRWICAPPRRFSQLVAAFFAKIRPGIRREPSFRLTILSFQQMSQSLLATLVREFHFVKLETKSLRDLVIPPCTTPRGTDHVK